MEAMMAKLLDALRDRVTQNLTILRQNEAEIRRILAEPLSNQRTHNLNNRYDVSKRIIRENTDNLAVQSKIVEFLHKHKQREDYMEDIQALNEFEEQVRNMQHENSEKKPSEEKPEVRAENLIQKKIFKQTQETNTPKEQPQPSTLEQLADSLFMLTAKGALAFNRSHPRFNDEEFFNDLLDYHTQREEYEVCARLIKAKKA